MFKNYDSIFLSHLKILLMLKTLFLKNYQSQLFILVIQSFYKQVIKCYSFVLNYFSLMF